MYSIHPMKQIIVLSLWLISIVLQAENSNPVKWSFSLSKQEIHVGDTIEIIAKAVIDEQWYLYSNDFDANLGPTLTDFEQSADA